MKNIIGVKIGLDHFWSCNERIIGREGESDTTQLKISLPTELLDYWAYLDFKKPNGETFKTPRLNVVNGVINYDIPLSLLDERGEIGVQLVLQNENGEIWKSAIKHYANRHSINAVDDIPDKEDFIAVAQKLLDDVNFSSVTEAEAETILKNGIELWKQEYHPETANDKVNIIDDYGADDQIKYTSVKAVKDYVVKAVESVANAGVKAGIDLWSQDYHPETQDNKQDIINNVQDPMMYPTVRAVKEYVDTTVEKREAIDNKVNEINVNAYDPKTKYPTVKAVTDYVESLAQIDANETIDLWSQNYHPETMDNKQDVINDVQNPLIYPSVRAVKEYVDTSIQEAINDSWGTAV